MQDPKTHRYSNSRGIPGLRRAICSYYKKRFNVTLDPESEAIVTIGSKEGLANLAQAITSPGDIMLVPNPSYPIHPFGFILAGASIRHLPIGQGHSFLNRWSGRSAQRAEAAGGRPELPVQPDGRGGGPGLLPSDRGVLP